ncbi:MAG TPA: hypothetical protein VKB80_08235, partial [Kofleriaceae bacterium]|nr:hypothetical protein [Kofleriaceae bacterium]
MRSRRTGARAAARVAVLAAAVAAVAAAGAGCESRPEEARAPAARVEVPAGHLVSTAVLGRVLREGSREQWFGMYLQGKKVGFAATSIRAPARAGGPLVWHVSGKLRSVGMGAATEVSFDEQRLYDSRPPHALLEVRSREDSGAGVVERVYRNGAGKMTAAQTTDRRAQPGRALPPSQETLLAALDQGVVEPSELRAGQSAVVREFD